MEKLNRAIMIKKQTVQDLKDDVKILELEIKIKELDNEPVNDEIKNLEGLKKELENAGNEVEKLLAEKNNINEIAKLTRELDRIKMDNDNRLRKRAFDTKSFGMSEEYSVFDDCGHMIDDLKENIKILELDISIKKLKNEPVYEEERDLMLLKKEFEGAKSVVDGLIAERKRIEKIEKLKEEMETIKTVKAYRQKLRKMAKGIKVQETEELQESEELEKCKHLLLVELTTKGVQMKCIKCHRAIES